MIKIASGCRSAVEEETRLQLDRIVVFAIVGDNAMCLCVLKAFVGGRMRQWYLLLPLYRPICTQATSAVRPVSAAIVASSALFTLSRNSSPSSVCLLFLNRLMLSPWRAPYWRVLRHWVVSVWPGSWKVKCRQFWNCANIMVPKTLRYTLNKICLDNSVWTTHWLLGF